MVHSLKNKCDTIVKNSFPSHKKCSKKKRKGIIKKGSFLNQYCLPIPSPTFVPSDDYVICSNLDDMFKKELITPPKPTKPPTHSTPFNSSSKYITN